MAEEEAIEGAALDRLLRIGGQEFLLEMIDLFLENAPQRIRAAQDALLGNRDSIWVSGGTLAGGRELIVRPDLPLIIDGWVNVLGIGTKLTVEPGASVVFLQSERITFDDGGTLDARGTPTDSVRFVQRTTEFWDGLVFRGRAANEFGVIVHDTSYVSHAVLDHGGYFAVALDARETHVLFADSISVVNSHSTPVVVHSRRSRVDPRLSRRRAPGQVHVRWAAPTQGRSRPGAAVESKRAARVIRTTFS